MEESTVVCIALVLFIVMALGLAWDMVRMKTNAKRNAKIKHTDRLEKKFMWGLK